MTRFFSLLGGLAVAALLVAACGGDDDSGGGTKASNTSPTAAVSSPSPTAAAAAVVDLSKDDLGRKVDLPANPQRIIALSPSIVELMFAVGATPVGRPSSADYPPEATDVASFGQSRSPNFEELAAMEPDLIIADATLHASIVDDLSSQLDVPVFAIRVASFDDVTGGLRKVGALTGNAEAAETAAVALEEQLAAIQAKLPAKGPTVLVLVAAGQNQFIASRGNTYLGDILTKLGAENLVKDEPENFGYPGFSDYSLERIIERDPDVIITASIGGPPGTPKTSDILEGVPALGTLKAVQENRVYEVDPFVYIQSAGPRVSLILEELPKLLYPDVFAQAR
jgi:ABC-type Fe3+-hydroxamate transport system substrate-binding protein